jgi:CubicO group peptidase (beta-lactamase class C family)
MTRFVPALFTLAALTSCTPTAAKSVTSTLLGAAIRDGLIGSIDDPITRYIPELKSAYAFDGVTLRHLMTMSSGLRFNENTTDPTSDLALTDGGEVIDGRPPIVHLRHETHASASARRA